MAHLSLCDLIPFLSWQAPFGNTGILPLIAHVISLYSPIDIKVGLDPDETAIFHNSGQTNVLRYDALILSNHEMLIAVCRAQTTEIIRLPNYQSSAKCTIVDEEHNIWRNQIDTFVAGNIIMEQHDSMAISQLFLNKKVMKSGNNFRIIDVWQQNELNNDCHYVLRHLSNNFGEILKISKEKPKRLYHFVLPDTYILSKPCCFLVNNQNLAFLIYHTFNSENGECSLGLRCCHDNGEVNDIEIPLCVLNETYSKTLNEKDLYIMNIHQKYCFYHKQSGKYLLFMDLTYRLRNLSGKKSNAMKFISSVFMWQFQVDWNKKKIQNIAVSGVKINMSLSGIGQYKLMCFDEENGAMLIHEKNTPNFVIKRLSDVIQEWKYYLQ